MERELDVAKKAALAAGKILMEHYGKVGADKKKDGSLVTKADTESEDKIKSILFEAFPDYSFLGEETGRDDRRSEYTWMVDPLDGTTNYAMKKPFFNVSIGLVKGNEPVVGVIHSPVDGETFTAVKGGGTFLNDKKARVSGGSSLESSSMVFCSGIGTGNSEIMSRINSSLGPAKNPFGSKGAAALELAYVSCGRLDSFVAVGAKPWDVAAGILLVSEAGGTVTDFTGNRYEMNSSGLIASNPGIHRNIAELISKALGD